MKDNAISAMLKISLYVEDESVRVKLIRDNLRRIPLKSDEEEQKVVEETLTELLER